METANDQRVLLTGSIAGAANAVERLLGLALLADAGLDRTAAMGTGPDAVVDGMLAIHGLEGVRVADILTTALGLARG